MKIKIILFTLLSTLIIFYIKQSSLDKQAKNKEILNSPYAKGYMAKKALLSKLQNNHNYKIIMIGDSLTAGNDWNKSFDRDDILNIGQGADFTDRNLGDFKFGVVNRLDGLDSNYKKAFVMLGFNDLNSGKAPNEIFTSYKKIIEIIQNKKIIPIIQSTLYITKNKYDFKFIKINNNIEILNNLLKNYSKKKNILFIDLNQNMSNNKSLKSTLTYDGVHLNSDGYLVWSDMIKQYISL
nr:GDSL-type esterase/lipase family protein [uncultured Sulfurimonas sp.]